MIIALVVIGIALMVWSAYCKHEDAIAFDVIGCILLGITGVTICASFYEHAENLGTIRAQHFAVEVQQNRVNALQTALKSIHSEGTALMNSDTPAKSLIDAIAAAQNDLATVAMKEADAKIEIASRKAGPWWFVPKIYGD
jgi:hypothetical protein